MRAITFGLRRSIASVACLGACLGISSCGPKAPPPRQADSPPTRPAHAVSAVVLVNRCAHLGVANAKLAEAAMNQLVDGCGSFSGGRARFTATLLPGGAIQFAEGPEQPQSIPVCVLTHPLMHRVSLQQPCALDVQLEESSVAVPKGGASP